MKRLQNGWFSNLPLVFGSYLLIATIFLVMEMMVDTGGYSTELFLEKPADDLHCSICLQVLRDPVQCQFQHPFCRSCLIPCLQVHPACPSCRSPLHPDSLIQCRWERALITLRNLNWNYNFCFGSGLQIIWSRIYQSIVQLHYIPSFCTTALGQDHYPNRKVMFKTVHTQKRTVRIMVANLTDENSIWTITYKFVIFNS